MNTFNLEDSAKPVWAALHAIRDVRIRIEQAIEANNFSALRALIEELNVLVDQYACERLAWYAGIIMQPDLAKEDKVHIWNRFQYELALGPRLTMNDVLDALTILCEARWRDVPLPCAYVRNAVFEQRRKEQRARWRHSNMHIPLDRITLKTPPSFAGKVQLEHDTEILFRSVRVPPPIRKLIVARLRGKVDRTEHGWSAQKYYALNRAVAADRQRGRRLRQWVRMYVGPKFAPKK